MSQIMGLSMTSNFSEKKVWLNKYWWISLYSIQKWSLNKNKTNKETMSNSHSTLLFDEKKCGHSHLSTVKLSPNNHNRSLLREWQFHPRLISIWQSSHTIFWDFFCPKKCCLLPNRTFAGGLYQIIANHFFQFPRTFLGKIKGVQGLRWHGFEGFDRTLQFLEKGSGTHKLLGIYNRN